MAKKNKAAAQDWHKEEVAKSRAQEDVDEQLELLRYAGEKRKSGFPCASTIASLGFSDAAAKLSQAYGLLSDAYYSMRDAVAKGSSNG